MKLPLYPEEEIQLGETFVTKRQLRKAVLSLYPELVEQYKIHSSFDKESGEIVKKYAWHSVFEIINRDGRSDIVIKKLIEG